MAGSQKLLPLPLEGVLTEHRSSTGSASCSGSACGGARCDVTALPSVRCSMGRWAQGSQVGSQVHSAADLAVWAMSEERPIASNLPSLSASLASLPAALAEAALAAPAALVAPGASTPDAATPGASPPGDRWSVLAGAPSTPGLSSRAQRPLGPVPPLPPPRRAPPTTDRCGGASVAEAWCSQLSPCEQSPPLPRFVSADALTPSLASRLTGLSTPCRQSRRSAGASARTALAFGSLFTPDMQERAAGAGPSPWSPAVGAAGAWGGVCGARGGRPRCWMRRGGRWLPEEGGAEPPATG